MIRSVPGRTPRVHPGAWVDPSAQVIGDVTIEEGASVWPLTVLRGDQDNYVTLGRNSNVQDWHRDYLGNPSGWGAKS